MQGIYLGGIRIAYNKLRWCDMRESFDPRATSVAVNDYEHNLQYYGLLEKCEKCARSCFQYNAPGLSGFFCADFRPKGE